MPRAVSRFLADYGMIFVLALLCVFFSVATLSEQSPSGDAAARQVATAIDAEFGKTPRVLIAVRDQADDVEFAGRLEALLTTGGADVPAVVKGEPKDARAALVRIAAGGGRLDAIAGTRESAAWLVFADVKADFPALGDPKVVQPKTETWPNFLKSENLVNIANQIAVIAIIAIGMTMVIVTGGIDLSVGSLLALSAVLAARFIRDYAGAEEASPVGMTLACLGAVAVCGLIGAFSGGMITVFSIPPFIVTLAMMLVCSGLAGTPWCKGQRLSPWPAHCWRPGRS